MLWSDPVKENGRHPSKRGVSIGFGPDVAQKFLQENNLGNKHFINIIYLIYFYSNLIKRNDC